jgi:hypothetical protein
MFYVKWLIVVEEWLNVTLKEVKCWRSMNVLLRVVTTLEVEEDQFDQYRYSYNYGQNVGLSMTLYDEALS